MKALHKPKSTPRKRVKPPKVAKLKKELESLQRALVVKRFGNDCFTCKQKNLKGANCQLGHVPWPRADLSVIARYDYRYTRIQCFRCNIHLGGAGAVAYQKMQMLKIDLNELREISEKQKGKPISRKWIEAKIHFYKFLLSPDDLL